MKLFKGKRGIIIYAIIMLAFVVSLFFKDLNNPFNKFMAITTAVIFTFLMLIIFSEYKGKSS